MISKERKKEYDRIRNMTRSEEHKAKDREKARIYYYNNRKKVCAQARIWSKINRKKLNLYLKERRHNKINERLAHNSRVRINVAIKGICKSIHTMELLGCTIDEFKMYLENKFREGMNWNNYGYRGWHIDHIKPCTMFDLTDSEQQKICFHYTNLQPLWAIDNFKKNRFLKEEISCE